MFVDVSRDSTGTHGLVRLIKFAAKLEFPEFLRRSRELRPPSPENCRKNASQRSSLHLPVSTLFKTQSVGGSEAKANVAVGSPSEVVQHGLVHDEEVPPPIDPLGREPGGVEAGVDLGSDFRTLIIPD